jgi:GNAT superfamily N-acetyltransferase
MWQTQPPEVLSPRFGLIESNLREMMKFFALARPAGAVEVRDGVQLVSSGINFSPFNSALLAEPLPSLHTQDFEAKVGVAASFFRARGERWSFWLCDDLVSPVVRKRARSILLQHRLRLSTEPPGMIADQLEPVRRELPEDLFVSEVGDEATRSDFSGVTACTFDLPYSICHEVYQGEQSWQGPLHGWVGYVRDEPVTTCATVVAGGAIGLYTVGTMPHFRKRGYSELMMRHVLAETRARTGLHTAILQSTTAGYPMYHKMGFRKAAQFSIFLSEH